MPLEDFRRHGRSKPYTEVGIRRLPCCRCGEPAEFQWQVCADGSLYRPICKECDIELNNIVLMFMRDPERHEKIKEYERKRNA